MSAVNALLNRVFDLLLIPLAPLPIVGSLVVVSLATAILMLVFMRVTTSQQALTATTRQMYADLLEMRLFKDDLPAMWRAQWSLFQHNVDYMRLLLGVMLWTFIPLALTVVQLDSYFGYSGVGVSEPVLVTATLKSRADVQDVALNLPSGARLDTSAVWFPVLQQMMWRVVADSNGEYVLRLRAGGTVYDKTLHVSDKVARRSPVRPSARLIDEVFQPSEAPLPDSAPFASITVDYPERRIDVFGAHVAWIVLYTALSIVFALTLKRTFIRSAK